MLQFMGSQRVGHSSVTELNRTSAIHQHESAIGIGIGPLEPKTRSSSQIHNSLSSCAEAMLIFYFIPILVYVLLKQAPILFSSLFCLNIVTSAFLSFPFA